MRRLLLLLSAAAALLAAAAVAGVGRPEAARGDSTTQQNVVTTTGRGTVTTVPDVATVSVGVRTEAATAADALGRNADAVTRVLAALRQAGGERLQTQQVSLYPSTDDQERTTGFVAQNSVRARSAIATTGGLLDAAAAAGANTVDGPMLERSDTDALYREALGKALRDARAKAEALAKAGGFSVGRVVNVSEAAAEPVPVRAEFTVLQAKADTPIEPGTQDVEANVTASFELK